MPHQSDAVYHSFFGLATAISLLNCRIKHVDMIHYTTYRCSKSTILRRHPIPFNLTFELEAIADWQFDKRVYVII